MTVAKRRSTPLPWLLSLSRRRRPPGKRINFQANATVEPFSCPWATVLPLGGDGRFYVMRDINTLFRVVTPIVSGKAQPTLEELDEFCGDARYALVPVIVDCDSTVVCSNAVVMVMQHDDNDVSSSSCQLDQPIGDNGSVRPVIGFIELADQCLLTGKGRGTGFVSLYQLLALCRSHRCASTVWFKNGNTRRLVQARLSVAI